MSRGQKLVARYRANEGAINDLIADVWRHYKEHGRESIRNAVIEAAADRAIQRYEEKIRNGFARAGLPLPAEPLDADGMLRVIRTQTGLELNSLNPDDVMFEVDRLLSQRLSAALQVNVTTVFDREALITAINESVRDAIRSGRAGQWLSKKAYRAARRLVTYKRRNISEQTAALLEARKRQKKFRRTHRLIWI